ncbi:hypothetical protein FHS33_001914 [Streptomyces calvus]|jgi:hypothetical protein|uniref:Uncharacterized protein n=1 Tax=Streptomyces calvus TaxID=67282 RepID=A0AA40SC06_9ACTN|nr:hypothetical protein [Streptomyces calvus]MBA8977134.1 hypothetical protein [Streptomyces calvus]
MPRTRVSRATAVASLVGAPALADPADDAGWQ